MSSVVGTGLSRRGEVGRQEEQLTVQHLAVVAVAVLDVEGIVGAEPVHDLAAVALAAQLLFEFLALR